MLLVLSEKSSLKLRRRKYQFLWKVWWNEIQMNFSSFSFPKLFPFYQFYKFHDVYFDNDKNNGNKNCKMNFKQMDVFNLINLNENCLC